MYTQLGAASRLDMMSALQAANLAPDPGARAQSAVLAAAVARLEASRAQTYDPDADDDNAPSSAQDGQGRADDEQTTPSTHEPEETP
jgi:hypothetical protein